MKRIRVMGLAFASVFALCAITASSALAGKGPNMAHTLRSLRERGDKCRIQKRGGMCLKRK